MKPSTPKTMPAIAPAEIPLLLLPSALSSLSFEISVLPGALVPVNEMKKGQTISIKLLLLLLFPVNKALL